MLRIPLITLAALVASLSTGGAQGDTTVEGQLVAYRECATAHVRQVATAQPTLTFEQQEASIRPACGRFVQRALTASVELGHSPDAAIAGVRAFYDSIQPTLRQEYDQARRRADGLRKQQFEEAQAKDKVLKATVEDHSTCLVSNERALVPYSVDAAETVATAIFARCSKYEDRLREMGPTLYSLPRSQSDDFISGMLAESRKAIVTRIVEFRAELLKRGSAAPGTRPAESKMY